MDLAYLPSERAFRDDVRAFFDSALPSSIRQKVRDGRTLSKEDLVDWQRILHRKGWAVPHWPREYGGTGWSAIQQYIFHEEMQMAPAPAPIPFGVDMVGPVIYTFGNSAQRSYFLPRIANVEHWWCQGFSEPNSGSDLASLRTRAKRRGDIYVVSGHKIWTTYAQYADWMFCLVRTDLQAKSQSGISFLLIDMRSPGVTVRPIITIDGAHEVNEVFLDDVEVPASHLVGEENKGWDYAKFLLGAERTGVARVGASKERIRRIKQIASESCSGGAYLRDDRQFQLEVSSIEAEIKALELSLLRVLSDERDRKGKANPASSLLKLKGSEIEQATIELLLKVTGPLAIPCENNERTNQPVDWMSLVAPNYFNSRKLSIYSGSNEIQRNIIAKAVLGL